MSSTSHTVLARRSRPPLARSYSELSKAQKSPRCHRSSQNSRAGWPMSALSVIGPLPRARVQLLRLLEDLMAPQPLILPDLHKAKRPHAGEGRPEILHNVLWGVRIRLRADAGIEESPWL